MIEPEDFDRGQRFVTSIGNIENAKYILPCPSTGPK